MLGVLLGLLVAEGAAYPVQGQTISNDRFQALAQAQLPSVEAAQVLERGTRGGAAKIVIRPGDTLWNLAQRYHTSIRVLAALNGIADPDLIRSGQILSLPDEPATIRELEQETSRASEAFSRGQPTASAKAAQAGTHKVPAAQAKPSSLARAMSASADQASVLTVEVAASGDALSQAPDGDQQAKPSTAGASGSVAAQDSAAASGSVASQDSAAASGNVASQDSEAASGSAASQHSAAASGSVASQDSAALPPQEAKPLKVSKDDFDLLARVIYAEARGEDFEGKVAVGAVVLNRLMDPHFPKTIRDIIYQPGQFTAVSDRQIQLYPDAEAYQAAEAALSGVDPTGGALYYFNPRLATDRWIKSRPVVKKIGNHTFSI